MRGEDVVCFSKDWDEASTSNHHVLCELARERRVLWLDSIATRTPRLDSSRDRARVARRIARVLAGPVRRRPDLYGLAPLALPWPHAPLARAVNRALLAGIVRAATSTLGMDRYQLWTFLPTVADYLDDPRATVRVYYCVDEWSLFGGLDERRTAVAEARLLRKVDVVFATSRALVESKSRLHPEVHFAPHGVDHGAFARALDRTTALPGELVGTPRPRIGFWGTLDAWFDGDLVAEVARLRPGFTFVLVGPERARQPALAGLPNVVVAGARPHASLPAYAAAFDVGIVPYRALPRLAFASPLKVREYLAAGLPVVATPGCELPLSPHVAVAAGAGEFASALDRALAAEGPAARRARSESVRADGWDRRVAEVRERVRRVAERRARRERGEVRQ